MDDKLKIMEGMAVKRYKVHVKVGFVETVTVYAHDKVEAQAIVLRGDGGRHAGRSAPKVEGIKIEEMGLGEPDSVPVK